jgi:hypothetical protein
MNAATEERMTREKLKNQLKGNICRNCEHMYKYQGMEVVKGISPWRCGILKSKIVRVVEAGNSCWRWTKKEEPYISGYIPESEIWIEKPKI